MHAIKFALAVAVAVVASTLLLRGPAAAAYAGQSHESLRVSLAAVRAATAPYRDLSRAKAGGYALFTDAAGIACIANPPAGAMGIHYVNGTRVGSGTIDALKPQALVYQPMEDGRLRLVAVEYIAFQQAWDASHSAPPMLFGQPFMLTAAPNRFGIPAFYSLHAWIWKDNPRGMFAMWNPRVQCGSDGDTAQHPAT